MFLQYVHNKTNFEELQQGLEHLKEHVQQQSSRRENLVRTHFGLFVQCADGLEWLKGYQEGKNLAANTNRRNSAPINPFDLKATLAAGTTTTAIGFEKGMSQLKNASAILDEAKIEAKKSLDPILSGIQKSREIRSAEKVLRGMSALLDYPHSMKLAFDRHDYQEVVHLYYRVLAIPNTTSLKIVAKVKSSAEMVIQDLKKSCLATLMSPQTNYGIIYKHARILLDLEGPQYYQQILRHCFLRNLLHVLLLLKDSKLRFIQDSLDAYEKGQELNRGPSGAAVTLKTMSNWTNSASNNSIVNESMRSSDEIQQNAILLMRKYASASTMSSYSAASTSSTRRRTSSGNSISVRPTLVVTGHTPNGISRKAFGNNGNSSKRQSTKRSVRRGSIGSNSSSAGNGMDEEYVLDEFDDPADHVQADLLYSEDEQMMIDDATTGKQQPWMRLLLSGAQFISDQPEDEEDDDGDHFQQDSIDYAEILCHVVRKTYGDNVMDVVGKHFHCLFQICVELLTQSINTANASTTGATTNGAVPVRGLVSQASTRLGGAPPTPFTSQASIRAGPGGFLSPPPSALPSKTANPATVPATVPTRSIGMSCSRLLGAILNNTSENLQQVVHGISKNLYANSKFASNVLGIPTEVLSTFSELDQFLNSVQSQFTNWSIKVDFSDFLTANSSNNIANPDANNTAIMMSVSRFMDLLKAASSGTANAMIVATVTNAFQKPLRNPLFDEALSDLYNLYDGLESIFKSSQANFNQQLDGAKGNSGAGGGTTIGGVPNYLSSPQYGNRSNILASPNRDSLEVKFYTR